MPEKLLPATIRARVHEDAITRVTRFFNATTVETLNELFQNARRAGASRVDVAIADGEVRVRDNGRGIADPSALLAFGRTGWDAETTRREDPAGMGVYSLARRPKVTIRSRPVPADGTHLPAWQVRLTPEHFLGHEIAPVEVIDGRSLAFGTEIVFDDDKANSGNVNSAARYFPLPVTCDGREVDRSSFLHDAVHVEEWRGIRLGVRARRYPPGRHPELNFHGILVEDVRLPVVDSMSSHWHVNADVVDCAELELVLPARKAIVETPFVDELRTACREAIYRAMLAADPAVDVPARVHADALAHGVELPIARAELSPWRPAFSNEYSTKHETPNRTALPDEPIVIEADMPPCDQQALWRAVRRAGISHRLFAEEPRYKGYRWYDQLAKATRLTTTAVLDGEEVQLEEQRLKMDPADSGRPEGITFTLETVERDGATGEVHIPGDVAFPDDDIGWAEDVSVLVTAGSEITPDDLAELIYDACFSPSDDCEADSYETQQDNYRQAAFAKALELLASAEEAMLSNVRTAIHRWVAAVPAATTRGDDQASGVDKPIEVEIEPSRPTRTPPAEPKSPLSAPRVQITRTTRSASRTRESLSTRSEINHLSGRVVASDKK